MIQERLDQRLQRLFIEILKIIETFLGSIDEDELIKKLFQEGGTKKIALLLNEPEKLDTI